MLQESWTIKDISNRSGIPSSTLHRWNQQGKIPGGVDVQHLRDAGVRFDAVAVQEWLEAGGVKKVLIDDGNRWFRRRALGFSQLSAQPISDELSAFWLAAANFTSDVDLSPAMRFAATTAIYGFALLNDPSSTVVRSDPPMVRLVFDELYKYLLCTPTDVDILKTIGEIEERHGVKEQPTPKVDA